MKKTIVIAIIIILLVIVGYFLINSSEISKALIGDDISDAYTNTNPDTNIIMNANYVKTFVITGENFKFVMNEVNNPDIRVKQGDKVRIEFSSSNGFHDWKVDEFNAATEKIRDGSSTSVEFIADKKGTFEYYCSIGKHRKMGMKGKLIVE